MSFTLQQVAYCLAGVDLYSPYISAAIKLSFTNLETPRLSLDTNLISREFHKEEKQLPDLLRLAKITKATKAHSNFPNTKSTSK